MVSDAQGEKGLVVAARDGAGARILAVGRLGRVMDLAAAPDGSRLAVAAHDGRLLLVDPITGADTELARSDNGAVADLAFSPDSRWLAWTHPGPDPLSQIKMARVADATVIDATTLRFADFSPTFTLDGRHLAFLSDRTFDPVYDVQVSTCPSPPAPARTCCRWRPPRRRRLPLPCRAGSASPPGAARMVTR